MYENSYTKFIEKYVARHIEEHLIRRYHSTETALLKVHSIIAEDLSEGSITALIMLDLSAAFHAICHPILLKRLELFFNLVKVVPDWHISVYSSG